MVDHNLVPFRRLTPGSRHNRLEVLRVPLEVKNAINVAARPYGRPTFYRPEHHLCKEIRPVACTQMNDVLNPALLFERRPDPHSRGEHHVGFAKIVGDEAYVLEVLP